MTDSSTTMPAATAPGMPIPMGVPALAGKARGPLTENDLQHIAPSWPAVLARSQRGKVLAVDASVDDPLDLTQAGWGVLFASDADPIVQMALQPLIELRRQQVNNDDLFRIFSGTEGVKPQQKASSWAQARGVTLTAPVRPTTGVPYYLLIVGSPERIPFEFQQELDLQWAVGRLYFDKADDYKAYAEKVVEYERGKSPVQSRRAAVWLPRNSRDLSTPLLAGTIGPDFLGAKPLGQRQKFQVTGFVGKDQATKENLTKIFSGKINGGAPSVLFTGSHGVEWPIADPFNSQWSSLAALLGQVQFGNHHSVAQPRPPHIANLIVARDDARNYIVLGDPAARLDVSRLQD